ncbi:MAG TPA: glycosyltransferase [Candidatus Limnocylindrales bacterium]|nr:glycosyltransferase [Candidatus Limnocylindrales bacterium]
MRIHILLPAYNEQEALPRLLERIKVAASTWNQDWCVVVLDDGSNDATAECARQFSGDMKIDIIKHPTNRGLAAAFRTGITHICSYAAPEDVLITLDADNTHDPGLIGEMLRCFYEGVDIVLASRFVPGGGESGIPLVRRILSHSARWVIKLLFPIPEVREYSCSFRGVRVALYQRALATYGEDFIQSTTFAVTPEILLKLSRFYPRIVEVPLVLRYDQKVGASKMRVWRNILGYLQLIWNCW